MPMGLAEQQLLQAPRLIRGRNQALGSIANFSSSKIRFSHAPNTLDRVKSGLWTQKTAVGPSIVRIPQLRRNRSTQLGKEEEHDGGNRKRGGEFRIPCLEAGVGETTGREATSAAATPAALVGVETAGFASDHAAEDITTPVVLFPEAGIEVVRSIEEAETVVLKAVIGIDHEDFLLAPGNCEIEEKSRSSEAEEGVLLPISSSSSSSSSSVSYLLKTSSEPSSDHEPHVTDLDVVVLNSMQKEQDPIPAAAASNKLVWAKKLDIQAQTIGPAATIESKNMWEQFRAILVFAGPALGMWLSGPIMSLIDTSVVGNSSSLELAALGPGTVLCDQLCYVFMFLSVATSNLIATSLAHKDEAGAAHHLSRLLFVSLGCGMAMFLITEFGATTLLQAFVGVNNAALVPAARTYVQIRALAWPAVLVGMVAQSASLGMQDSWGPLKVLAIASLINLCGDIFLCTFLGYGIAGAAWATAASQYVASFLMMRSLNAKGYNPLAIMPPSWNELVHMVNLAAPVLLTMLSKVMFYTCLTYLATSLGAVTLAAHQVMIGVYSLCTVTGEPLAQTAQSFMPALIQGSNRNFKQARSLLHSLMLIGAVMGLTLGCMAISVPWFFPQLFTKDPAIIHQAGRDLKFLGFSMASCFCGGSLFLLAFNRIGLGLQASWWTLAGFQWARFLQSYMRLASPQSILRDPIEEIALKMA
ncbi:hypothetical protein BDL97_12G036100 [Sphagnum fallax]|nr:hypothetical protein BDL97_12G036100 [Sphagnum fallax]